MLYQTLLRTHSAVHIQRLQFQLNVLCTTICALIEVLLRKLIVHLLSKNVCFCSQLHAPPYLFSYSISKTNLQSYKEVLWILCVLELCQSLTVSIVHEFIHQMHSYLNHINCYTHKCLYTSDYFHKLLFDTCQSKIIWLCYIDNYKSLALLQQL